MVRQYTVAGEPTVDLHGKSGHDAEARAKHVFCRDAFRFTNNGMTIETILVNEDL